MASTEVQADGGFVPFFRRYTKTWVHTVATVGLTAFGTLTFVHRWFVVLAFASYLVPPVVLYLRHSREETDLDSKPSSDTAPGDGSDAAASNHERPPTSGRDRDRETSHEETDPSVDTLEPGEAGGEALESETQVDGSPDGDDADQRNVDERPTAEDRTDGEGDEDDEDDEGTPDPATWRTVESPTAVALTDVVVTDADAAYAVGSEGVVLADTGEHEWTILLADGPAAGSNALHGVDAIDDGNAVWIAGDSGAVGRIDTDSGRHTDYTAPNDITDNWLGVAVGGQARDETVLLINGSGAVVRGRYRDGDLEWNDPVKPGSGSSLSGVDLADSVGYCCDTNDGVFATEDGGESFERIGLDGADGTLEAIAAAGDDCLVCADDGVVHRYDGDAATWTPERVVEGALSGIAVRDERALACAADGSIHERLSDSATWEQIHAEGDASLHSVSIGADRVVAVGEDGFILDGP
ncbi:hypothetical protein ACLI4Z_07805 [Natrialbaceae archaeon A-arb3/5]